ncbi:hypothetical protein Ddye_013796 [Dipteronia dyeriana]|uniref:Reverse transcriptase domain-containing protein n=1 Tax=Dipteronia dyeriana TaxID=168575 RepID=A0AAD9X6U8_9ROSI|nr:hypothetical protein Ddye_013796 [Dipteronia dyeriana]
MAFVKGRRIIDSFVIAEEVVQKWKKDKEGGLVVKLDFEKAYDNVYHSLDAMLENTGFGFIWRGWIRSCISSSLLSDLVNGNPSKQFHIERWLRQGDPLSPFLFNIVIEGLNFLLQRVVELNSIRGENFWGSSSHTSHLRFEDDTISIIKPKLEYLLNSKRIIRCFKLASSLKINFHKSCVVGVGKLVIQNHEWAAVFKCQSASLPIPYLGLSHRAKPRSKTFWMPLVSKIKNCLAPCKKNSYQKVGGWC